MGQKTSTVAVAPLDLSKCALWSVLTGRTDNHRLRMRLQELRAKNGEIRFAGFRGEELEETGTHAGKFTLLEMVEKTLRAVIGRGPDGLCAHDDPAFLEIQRADGTLHASLLDLMLETGDLAQMRVQTEPINSLTTKARAMRDFVVARDWVDEFKRRKQAEVNAKFNA